MIPIILAAIGGGVIGYAIGNNGNDDTMPNQTQPPKPKGYEILINAFDTKLRFKYRPANMEQAKADYNRLVQQQQLSVKEAVKKDSEWKAVYGVNVAEGEPFRLPLDQVSPIEKIAWGEIGAAKPYEMQTFKAQSPDTDKNL
jgi:hypothetical protein